MIEIPPDLQARPDAGVTTLSWAWILTRRDGARHGFTDHDQRLQVDGVSCESASGFSAGDLRSETGTSPARGAVFGQLESGVITKDAIKAGAWDGAALALYRVDWSDPTQTYRAFTGELGEIRYGDQGFEAEVSGPSARLNRTIGRVFSRLCDAELGDACCQVDLAALGRRVSGVLAGRISRRALRIAGVDPAPGDARDVSEGVLVWTAQPSWPDQRIVTARADGAGLIVELDSAAPGAQTGEALSLTVGCDKRFETCKGRFSNAANFRGCPHMPGNDALIRPVSARQ